MEIVKVIVSNETESVKREADLSLTTGIIRFSNGEYGHLANLKGFRVLEKPEEPTKTAKDEQLVPIELPRETPEPIENPRRRGRGGRGKVKG